MRSWTFLTFQTPCLCEHTSVIISNIWISTNCACGCNITCMHFINIGGIFCTFGGTHTHFGAILLQFISSTTIFSNLKSSFVEVVTTLTASWFADLKTKLVYSALDYQQMQHMAETRIQTRGCTLLQFPRSNWSLCEKLLFLKHLFCFAKAALVFSFQYTPLGHFPRFICSPHNNLVWTLLSDLFFGWFGKAILVFSFHFVLYSTPAGHFPRSNCHKARWSPGVSCALKLPLCTTLNFKDLILDFKL